MNIIPKQFPAVAAFAAMEVALRGEAPGYAYSIADCLLCAEALEAGDDITELTNRHSAVNLFLAYTAAQRRPTPPIPFHLESLEQTLIRRDGMTRAEAREAISEARELVAEGADPEEVLREEFGLEPDYVFDLLGARA